ncbi:hypothetical protein MHTCC0001_30510 [Flavobacteriaceae bacterium MHTCC 0001]
MRKILKIVTIILALGQSHAQSVKGGLTVNNSNTLEIDMETNSVVSLFKDFKTKKYKLGFSFKTYDVPKNSYGETIVFFDMITQVKKEGKLIKEIRREAPFPYFPGDMFLAPETFDFIPILSAIDGNNLKTPKHYGTMPAGNYSLVLIIEPKGFEGEIHPLEILFKLSRRPTR